MKKRHLFIACLMPVALWLAVPWAVNYQLARTQTQIPECLADLTSDKCRNVIASLGQTGDTFGIVSSLFSGLALFAVALTLWSDVAARRRSRKPLIVCTINQDREVFLDEPSHSDPKEIRFSAYLDVMAANDTALNAKVEAKLMIGTHHTVQLPSGHLQMPLLAGKPQTLSFLTRLNHSVIRSMAHQFDEKKQVQLMLSATCESLEGQRWQTSVTYLLSTKKESLDRLKLLDGDEVESKTAWENAAAIALFATVSPGSWKYLAT